MPKTNQMSKIYEFSPSGLQMQNRIMVVIPLLEAHSYDYDNMTLMYREDKTCEFRRADRLKKHKPTWLFHRNSCYLFLSHFCGTYVADQGREEGSFVYRFCCCFCEMEGKRYLDTLLFYKYQEKTLELLVTFGCYNEKSSCSTSHVKKVFYTM